MTVINLPKALFPFTAPTFDSPQFLWVNLPKIKACTAASEAVVIGFRWQPLKVADSSSPHTSFFPNFKLQIFQPKSYSTRPLAAGFSEIQCMQQLVLELQRLTLLEDGENVGKKKRRQLRSGVR